MGNPRVFPLMSITVMNALISAEPGQLTAGAFSCTDHWTPKLSSSVISRRTALCLRKHLRSPWTRTGLSPRPPHGN